MENIKTDVPLKNYTTLRIGGNAKFLCEVENSEELIDAVKYFESKSILWKIIGDGSNILASDKGTDQAIIVFKNLDQPHIDNNGYVTVSGGSHLKEFIYFLAGSGLAGLEDLYGIPGTVGGAIAGNAGAYGVTISDHLIEANLLFSGGAVKKYKKEDFSFAYRSSSIKRSTCALLDATFKLSLDEIGLVRERAFARLSDRKSKHPDYTKVPTAGSWFKNPPGAEGKRVSAGKLLEEADCKELKFGGAYIWPVHANIVVTDGTARASDVIALSDEMKKRVGEKFGVFLEEEICRLD